jgi:hypothetical protein
MIDVFEEGKGEFWTYSLPPQKALVARYEQYRGNYNTWEYKDPSQYPLKFLHDRIVLGRFYVMNLKFSVIETQGKEFFWVLFSDDEPVCRSHNLFRSRIICNKAIHNFRKIVKEYVQDDDNRSKAKLQNRRRD